MNDAIKRYKKAEAELEAAEQALNEAVRPYLFSAMNDVDRIMRIVQMMPKTYNGVRRMYEQILRIKSYTAKKEEEVKP